MKKKKKTQSLRDYPDIFESLLASIDTFYVFDNTIVVYRCGCIDVFGEGPWTAAQGYTECHPCQLKNKKPQGC